MPSLRELQRQVPEGQHRVAAVMAPDPGRQLGHGEAVPQLARQSGHFACFKEMEFLRVLASQLPLRPPLDGDYVPRLALLPEVFRDDPQ
ncbi:MAG: hypothetical protein JO362_24910 [Streptomycetaceae bacterium]|nr:hypothetical protein [Streptomycetaceae bacterium]